MIIIVVVVVIDFVVIVVDTKLFFENDHRRRHRRRLVVVTRLSCLGLPPRSVVAARLECPIWEVRKRPKSAPGLPETKIVKFDKGFIKKTIRIWSRSEPAVLGPRTGRVLDVSDSRSLHYVCGETAYSCFW